MMRVKANDLDYLAARLYGRRSRLAENVNLDALCRLRTLADLSRNLFPNEEVQTTSRLQQRLLQDLARELVELAGCLTGAAARLTEWMLTRFQVENLKVLARGLLTNAPRTDALLNLIPLPDSVTPSIQLLAAAPSLPNLIARIPKGPLRESLQQALARYGANPRPFFFEAELDRGYFRELLDRGRRLPSGDQLSIKPMLQQEVDTFHLLLVARGRFIYDLAPDLLLPLHIAGTSISRQRFAGMLQSANLAAALAGLTAPMRDPAAVEAQSWSRYERLANRAFRGSPLQFALVAGYAGLRRVEVANLITLSEGIRAGVTVDAIRARMIPRTDLEVTHA